MAIEARHRSLAVFGIRPQDYLEVVGEKEFGDNIGAV